VCSSDLTILHVFMKEIAWLWVPLPILMLATNIVVVRLALRPLAHAVAEAEAIQPGGVSVLLSERDLPEDLLALVRAVNQAIGRLRDGYRAQEEFAGDIAHELRTPLAVMRLQLATIAEPQARLLESDLQGMERLVEQLIDRARLGRFHLEPGDVVELNDVAREVASFLGPGVIARGRMIEVVSTALPLRVNGCHDEIFRALRNLVENALEHSPPGGLISVEIAEDPAVSVTDRGPGFPARILDAERRRSVPLRSDRRAGAGLGLSIVERTMWAHGGRLDLTNTADGGGRATLAFRRLAPVAPA
jgi:signal transduction histidine kinase